MTKHNQTAFKCVISESGWISLFGGVRYPHELGCDIPVSKRTCCLNQKKIWFHHMWMGQQSKDYQVVIPKDHQLLVNPIIKHSK